MKIGKLRLSLTNNLPMYPSYDMILLRKNLIEEIVRKHRSVNEVADILSVRRETGQQITGEVTIDAGGFDAWV